MNRRSFLRSASGILIAAPLVVKAGILMPVRKIVVPSVGVDLARTRDRACILVYDAAGNLLATMPIEESASAAWANGKVLRTGIIARTMIEGNGPPRDFDINVDAIRVLSAGDRITVPHLLLV